MKQTGNITLEYLSMSLGETPNSLFGFLHFPVECLVIGVGGGSDCSIERREIKGVVDVAPQPPLPPVPPP